jgi:hypothetical protein
MTQFHTDDYIDFLSRVTPDNMEALSKEQAKCKTYFQPLSFAIKTRYQFIHYVQYSQCRR